MRHAGKPSEQREFAVSEGQELALDLDQASEPQSLERRRARELAGPTAAPAAPGKLSQHRKGHSRPLTAYLAYGVGGAGALLFAVTGPLALADDHALSRGCGRASTCSASQVAGADRLALAADIGLGVAVGGLVVGTIALVAQRRGERRLSMIPTASRAGAGLVTRMWF